MRRKPFDENDIAHLKLLLDAGKTIDAISYEMNASEITIYKYMRINNLMSAKRRKIIENKKNEKNRWGEEIAKKLLPNEKSCTRCGKEFYVRELGLWAYKRGKRMYCSWTCMRKAEGE